MWGAEPGPEGFHQTLKTEHEVISNYHTSCYSEMHKDFTSWIVHSRTQWNFFLGIPDSGSPHAALLRAVPRPHTAPSNWPPDLADQTQSSCPDAQVSWGRGPGCQGGSWPSEPWCFHEGQTHPAGWSAPAWSAGPRCLLQPHHRTWHLEGGEQKDVLIQCFKIHSFH